MKINIQPLINQSELNFQCEGQITLKGLGLPEELEKCAVKVQGLIAKKGLIYWVKADVEAMVNLMCDRCMKQYETTLHTQFLSQYSADQETLNKGEDIQSITKSSIDLVDSVTEAIYLELPMKKLCSEDCKGICKNCGCDLNSGTCDCDQSDIDPRLEQLKNIFDFAGKN